MQKGKLLVLMTHYIWCRVNNIRIGINMKYVFIFFIISIIQLHSQETIETIIQQIPEQLTSSTWQLDNEIKTYSGENLFDYMNGGAEIYLEYGVETLKVFQYKSNDSAFNVELYKMYDGHGAFGLFSYLISNSDTTLSINRSTDISDYFISFYKGKYFCRISYELASKYMAIEAKKIADSIKEIVEDSSDIPKLITIVNYISVNHFQIKYFKGKWAFSNLIRGEIGRIKGFEEGIYGKSSNAEIVILNYEKNELSNDSFEELRNKVSQKYDLKYLNEKIQFLSYVNKRNKRIEVSLYNNYLIIFVVKDESTETKKILEKIIGRL